MREDEKIENDEKIYRTIGISTIIIAPKWNIIHAKLNLMESKNAFSWRVNRMANQEHLYILKQGRDTFTGTGMIASIESGRNRIV